MLLAMEFLLLALGLYNGAAVSAYLLLVLAALLVLGLMWCYIQPCKTTPQVHTDGHGASYSKTSLVLLNSLSFYQALQLPQLILQHISNLSFSSTPAKYQEHYQGNPGYPPPVIRVNKALLRETNG